MARRSLGKLAAAEAGARQAWAAYRRTVGPEHPWTLTTLSNLAVVLSDRGNHAAAESALAEVLSARRRVLGNAHPDVAHVLAWLGEVRYRRGRHAEAEVASREAVAINRKALPAGHPELSRGLRILGKVLCAGGETEEGERTLQHALESDPRSAHSQRELGACLAKRGQFAEAEALLLESFRRLGLSQDNWFAHLGRIQTAQALADLYLTWGKPEKAARYRRFTAEDPGSASPSP
jgi:tetratricopeptide (TPR) repeat protein